MATEIINAQIVSTRLGREDHGIFTAYVTVSGDGWGCSFGGWSLDEWSEPHKRRIGRAYGVEFISSVLDTVGVSSWEQLEGQHIRVEIEDIRIRRIGHITKNKWFDPRALYDELSKDDVSCPA